MWLISHALGYRGLDDPPELLLSSDPIGGIAHCNGRFDGREQTPVPLSLAAVIVSGTSQETGLAPRSPD